MPEDQKGDVVAPATDKKETEEEDMDAPWMRFAIETTKTLSRRWRFRFCAEASGFLNPNVESSGITLALAEGWRFEMLVISCTNMLFKLFYN